jgi:hypothetical protein
VLERSDPAAHRHLPEWYEHEYVNQHDHPIEHIEQRRLGDL